MSEAEATYARRGKLGVVTLNRPAALNALTMTMIAEIERLIRAAEKDPAVAAICITGAGRGFCAGLDMNTLTAHVTAGGPPKRTGPPKNSALFSFILDISKPVIAAINGVGAGGGFVLAMMCDLRFMANEASLTTVFTKRGLIAEHGTSWLLPRIVGLSRALDLLWSSRRITAEEAYRIGFADRLVPADRLLDEVEAYVNEMFAVVSPRSVAVIKAAVHRHLEMGIIEASHDTEALIDASLKHPDSTEGAASYVERRPPQFAPWTGED